MFKSPPSDLQMETDKLFGFYRAVVEDSNDPLKSGRVRIRIHGLHTEKTEKTELEGIPTEELPWAEPCMPIHEGSISGFGTWSVPLQGSQVMVFFENGNLNRPIYFASLPGIPQSKDYYSNNNRETKKTYGFKDPNGEYPLKNRLGESDFHRLSRGITDDTIIDTKNNGRDLNVSTALGGSWSEPAAPYNSKYPHNYVIATHGGIIIELDSTPGSKRINIYHPSNSFIEIDNNGNMVIKNEGEKYEIIVKGKNIHIKEDRNLNIDTNSKRKIGGNEDIEIGGSKDEEITGDETKTIDGDKIDDIGGDKSETIGGNKDEDIGGNLTITITGNANVTASGNIQLTAPNVTITGITTITGNATINGSIAGSGGSGGTLEGNFVITTGDITADGISLKSHTHTDPQGGVTGPPM